MLTPAKIKNHHFEASGRNGYHADSVDAFFEEVADSYEQMFRENGEMFKKINLLAERLEEYRNDENNIRDALLTAQRMSEQITNEAQEKANKTLFDAQSRANSENAKTDADVKAKIAKANEQAKSIIDSANKQADKIMFDATHESKEAAVVARNMMIKEEASLQMLQVEVTRFKKRVTDAYNAQLRLIEQLPEVEKEEESEIEIPDLPEDFFNIEEEKIPEPETTETVIEDVQDEQREAENIDVNELQQMIYESEDTDADEDIAEEYDAEPEAEQDIEDAEIAEENPEIVIPEVEEKISDEDLDRIVNNYTNDNVKAKDTKNDGKDGFKVNLDQISTYNSDTIDDSDEDSYLDDIDDEDEYDDDDDDDDEGLTSKLKGFFRK